MLKSRGIVTSSVIVMHLYSLNITGLIVWKKIAIINDRDFKRGFISNMYMADVVK